MLQPENPATIPLEVNRVESTACPPVDNACGTRVQDALSDFLEAWVSYVVARVI
jgi:hypothetical protein